MEFKDALAKARKDIVDTRDPSLVAYMISDYQEVKDAGCYDLAYLLGRGEYGCHRNDVTGLLDLLEQWLGKQETT